MRAIKLIAVAAAFALLLPLGVFARDNSNSANFDLAQRSQIGHTVLR